MSVGRCGACVCRWVGAGACVCRWVGAGACVCRWVGVGACVCTCAAVCCFMHVLFVICGKFGLLVLGINLNSRNAATLQCSLVVAIALSLVEWLGAVGRE